MSADGAVGLPIGLRFKYDAKANDSALSEQERKAASLFLKAELNVHGDGEFEHGITNANDCADLYRKLGKNEELADTLRLLVHIYSMYAESLKSGYDKERWESLFESGERVAREEAGKFKKLNDRRGEACMMLAEAELSWSRRGPEKTEEAKELAIGARKIFKEIGDVRLEASAIMALQMCFFECKIWDKVKELSMEVIKMCESIDDLVGMGFAYHAYASAQVNSHAHQESLKSMHKSLECFRKGGDLLGLAAQLEVVAGLYCKMDNPRAAVPLAREALNLYRDVGTSPFKEATALAVMLECLDGISDFDQGLKIATDGVARLRQRGVPSRVLAEALHTLLNAHLLCGNTDDAVRAGEEGISLCREFGHKFQEAEFFHQLASVYGRAKMWGDALYNAEEAKMLYEECHTPPDKMADIFNYISRILIADHQYEDALDNAKEAMKFAAETGDKDVEAFALLNNAPAYGAVDDMESYQSSVKEALQLFTETGNKRGEGRGTRMLADVQKMDEKYEDALENARKGEKLAEEAGDRVWQAKALQTVAQLHMINKSPKEAVRPALKAVKLHKFSENFIGAAEACCQVIEAHTQYISMEGSRMSSRQCKESLDKALKACKECNSLAARAKHKQLKAGAQYWLGHIIRLHGRSEEARGILDNAIELAQKADDRVILVHSMMQKAICYKEEQNEEKSRPLFKEVLKLAEEMQMKDIMDAARDFLGAEAPVQAKAAAATSEAAAPGAGAEAGDQVSVDFTPPDREMVRGRIQQLVLTLAGSSEIPPDDEPLMEAGIDSLAAVELRTQMVKEFGISLPSTVLFNYPSIGGLTTLLISEATEKQISIG